LEILAYHFSGALPPGMPQGSSLPVDVHVGGISYKPEEISYVPSGGRFSGGSPTSLANMPQVRQQVLQYAKNASSYFNDITNTIRARRIQSHLGVRNPHQIDAKELERLLPEFDFAIDDVDITAGLIPPPTDQYAFAQSRIPIDMMVHGRAASLFHASAQWSTMSS